MAPVTRRRRGLRLLRLYGDGVAMLLCCVCWCAWGAWAPENKKKLYLGKALWCALKDHTGPAGTVSMAIRRLKKYA